MHGISKTGPMRTCIGCRRRASQTDLLRVVAVGTELVPDGPVRQPGRGAYLHRDVDCLELARRRRAYSRALRTTGSLSDETVVTVVQQEN